MWTEDQDDVLRTMANEGATASAIGAMLGYSRNAVIGRAHRAKIQLQAKAVKSPAKPKRSAKLTRHKPTLEHAGPPVVEHEPIPAEAIPLMDLGPYNCRWPFGEKPYLFCGAAKYVEDSYCPFHQRMSYRPAGPLRVVC